MNPVHILGSCPPVWMVFQDTLATFQTPARLPFRGHHPPSHFPELSGIIYHPWNRVAMACMKACLVCGPHPLVPYIARHAGRMPPPDKLAKDLPRFPILTWSPRVNSFAAVQVPRVRAYLRLLWFYIPHAGSHGNNESSASINSTSDTASAACH